MANVITMQDRSPEILQNFMQNYLQARQAQSQREMQEKELAQRDSQHKDSLTYNNRVESDRVTSEKAKLWMETVAKPLANDPARLSQEISKLRSMSPDVFGHLESLSGNTQATPGQMASQNADKFSQAATERALSGSQNVQDIDVTRQIGGTPMQKFAFEDQTQRQGGAQPYSDFVARQGGAKTTASEDQKNSTNRDLGFAELKQNAPVKSAQADMYRAQADRDRMAARPAIGPTGNNLTGEEYLKTLPPGFQTLVKKVANYEMDLSKVTSMRSGQREQIAAMVAQYDPSFDMTKYEGRQKTVTDFASGASAKNRTALNTAIKHLESLDKAGSDLDNTRFPLLNKVINAASKQTGNGAIDRYNQAALQVTNELVKVFRGTGASDSEVKHLRESFNADQSPEQKKASIQEAVQLIGGRLSALKDQYEKGVGKSLNAPILSSDSRKILERLGVDPESVESGSMSTSQSPAAGPSPAALSLIEKYKKATP